MVILNHAKHFNCNFKTILKYKKNIYQHTLKNYDDVNYHKFNQNGKYKTEKDKSASDC